MAPVKCQPCPDNSTTQSPGGRSVAECGCKKGYYKPTNSSYCQGKFSQFYLDTQTILDMLSIWLLVRYNVYLLPVFYDSFMVDATPLACYKPKPLCRSDG